MTCEPLLWQPTLGSAEIASSYELLRPARAARGALDRAGTKESQHPSPRARRRLLRLFKRSCWPTGPSCSSCWAVIADGRRQAQRVLPAVRDDLYRAPRRPEVNMLTKPEHPRRGGWGQAGPRPSAADRSGAKNAKEATKARNLTSFAFCAHSPLQSTRLQLVQDIPHGHFRGEESDGPPPAPQRRGSHASPRTALRVGHPASDRGRWGVPLQVT
jgi:hypothetical protein